MNEKEKLYSVNTWMILIKTSSFVRLATKELSY